MIKLYGEYRHPVAGHCWLWGCEEKMRFFVGTVGRNMVTFDGHTLSEVKEQIANKGFVFVDERKI